MTSLPCVCAGGLRGGRRLAALPEGSGLAPLQEHLHGLVRHSAHLGPHQRRHHGHLHLRRPVSAEVKAAPSHLLNPQAYTHTHKKQAVEGRAGGKEGSKDGTLQERWSEEERKPEYLVYLKPTTAFGKRRVSGRRCGPHGSQLRFLFLFFSSHPRICGLPQLDHLIPLGSVCFVFLLTSYLITL